MKCPLDGDIQAYIDGETDAVMSKELEEHLSGCLVCKGTYNKLIEINHFSREKLVNYSESLSEVMVHIKPFKDNKSDSINHIRKAGYDFMIRNKKILASTCAVLVIALCITVQPVRAAISDALSIFRVENVKSISISVDDLTKIQREINSRESNINLDKLGNIETSGGEMQELSPSEISKVTDFKVLLPSNDKVTKMQIFSTNPSKLKFDLNISNVNSLLSSLGTEKLLSESLRGKTFSIDIPESVNIRCSSGDKRITIIETKSPELQVPADVNVDDIYSSLVDLPILPENLQKQLKSIKDWKTTMYVPVIESQMNEVDINGIKGYASDKNFNINNKGADKSSYVIWFKDGTFYGISGNADRSELINIAQSMR